MQNSTIQYDSPLEAAICWLIAQQKVKEAKDVLVATGEHKGNFSMYKSGDKTPSPNFVLRLKSAFHIDLADFADKKWPNSDAAPRSQSTIETKLEVLLAVLTRIQREEYDGKTEQEIVEIFQKESIAKIRENKKGTQSGGRKKDKVKS